MTSPKELRRLQELFPEGGGPSKIDIVRWVDVPSEEFGPILYSDGRSTRVGKGLKHTAVFGASGTRKSRSYMILTIIKECDCGHHMAVADCMSLFKSPFDLIKSACPDDVSKGKGLSRDLAGILCPVMAKQGPSWEMVAANMAYFLAFLRIRTDALDNLVLLGYDLSDLDPEMVVVLFVRFARNMGFRDVDKMAERMLDGAHHVHLAQKELVNVLKWACFDLSERMRKMPVERFAVDSLVRYRQCRDAVVDFLCALLHDGRLVQDARSDAGV